VWLCKLNERGMLRPSFIPPVEIRELRDYTRLRADLVAERTRHKQRVEKLLEDSLIKLSTVATDIFGKSGRAMLDALIAGERDPDALAELALGKLRSKRPALREALTGRFDQHHADLIAMLLDQVDTLTIKIDTLTLRVEQLLADIPAAAAPPRPGPDTGDTATAPLSAVARLDEITGIGMMAAQTIIAEIGLDMSRFPTPSHLTSWAKFAPGIAESAARKKGHSGTGHGNRYLARALGEAAIGASRTNTFLGERYRRIARRRGSKRAIVAVGRSILVIIWQLLNDPEKRFVDLGPGYYEARINRNRSARNHVRELQALGYKVILEPAA
jgi:transposase